MHLRARAHTYTHVYTNTHAQTWVHAHTHGHTHGLTHMSYSSIRPLSHLLTVFWRRSVCSSAREVFSEIKHLSEMLPLQLTSSRDRGSSINILIFHQTAQLQLIISSKQVKVPHKQTASILWPMQKFLH